MKKLIRYFGVLLVVLCVVGAVLAFNLYIFISTPYGDSNVSLRFEKGTSVHQIVSDLEKNQVVSSILFFKAYIWMNHAGGNIRAGEYIFPPQKTPEEILDMLSKGDFATHKVTIPEGWTVNQIGMYLASLNLVNLRLFLYKCTDPTFIHSLGMNVPTLEGYLFPDTYEIYKPKNEEEVIRKFVEHFKEVYAKNFAGKENQVGLTPTAIITMASIVEKETAAPYERPIIASVFYNRLKKNMPLASDPTIIYSIPNFSGNLTRADLERPTSYNTYLNKGLTPTPIANPGKDAIYAVLNPAQTNYLFFVSRNDGTHQFSETEQEHFAAVRKYQSKN